MKPILIILIYLIFINIVGFAMMGIDKKKAKKRAFRIPEASLFIIAIIGGSLGSIAGMYFFKHKTRHWYFVYGMPAIFVLHIILAIVLYFMPLTFFTL
ncbi:MAG: DUF1294 domain-containing protein [Lachnospiraceae bacterium]|nr:DUF1294 domain-containing protein [Lachnospiraceae bacterium]MBR5944662.1 DUF1294 domain-containing protein [Lachnospiraceae bacterium]